MDTQNKEALIAEIEQFKEEALKMHIVQVLADSYTNTNLFDYNIDSDGSVIWYKAQARQLWDFWQAKAQAVLEESKRQGGYYIRDLRNQPGNCMKFWYQAGYGTKHKNFFWCETLEQAKEYQGRCGWFEIWHAPYIDSIVEHTVDFQLADRSIGFVDLEAQEQKG